uniref:Putative secreted protein n=1 Tax=Anopheles marajoara TaxID=58244 RepID=A0A2M4C700_9DIPT
MCMLLLRLLLSMWSTLPIISLQPRTTPIIQLGVPNLPFLNCPRTRHTHTYTITHTHNYTVERGREREASSSSSSHMHIHTGYRLHHVTRRKCVLKWRSSSASARSLSHHSSTSVSAFHGNRSLVAASAARWST